MGCDAKNVLTDAQSTRRLPLIVTAATENNRADRAFANQEVRKRPFDSEFFFKSTEIDKLRINAPTRPRPGQL